MLYLISSLGGY